MCFTSLFAHEFLPVLSVVLVPDKASKYIYSKGNYGPIALASVSSKIMEIIILGRIEIFF